ncbi:unnamed protein product, partial [Amoebophrya sp. A120]
ERDSAIGARSKALRRRPSQIELRTVDSFPAISRCGSQEGRSSAGNLDQDTLCTTGRTLEAQTDSATPMDDEVPPHAHRVSPSTKIKEAVRDTGSASGKRRHNGGRPLHYSASPRTRT